MTGATSGFGLIAACELASHGNKVIATARNSESANKLKTHFESHFPGASGTIEIFLCDLSSFESIVNACTQVKANNNYIDVLINNAGLWNFSYRESYNHIEETLHVNVLAPLLINHLLLGLLSKSNQPKSIFTVSGLHQGNVDFSNLEFKNNFSGFKAYRQSKLEVIMLCRLLAKKLNTLKIGVYSQHPGLVNTKLARDANWFSKSFFRIIGLPPAVGARTLIYLAEENKDNLISGEYYYKNAVKEITPQSYDLKVASVLLEKLTNYLKDYIGSPSIILEAKV